LHISQVMDDHIDVDVENQRLVGKETRRDIRVNNDVRARIVTVSVNERNPRESKIGLTMRQAGLGKLDWIQDLGKKEEN
ncbi:MAG: DNA-directed RNA polymerase, partial [Thermoplasmata archaeon]|nr:DNA-directed RNA polymerase [Thermoplasmata archaeon]